MWPWEDGGARTTPSPWSISPTAPWRPASPCPNSWPPIQTWPRISGCCGEGAPPRLLTAPRYSPFLKTKLALPTEEELQELLQKYPKDRRLALGAYLEFRRWVDDQGNPLPPGHSPWHTPPKGKEKADPSTASSWEKGHSPRTPWWMNCYWNFLQIVYNLFIFK